MEPTKNFRVDAIMVAALIGVTVICYLPSLSAPWQFDDYRQIIENRAVHAGSLSLAALRRAALESPNRDRPLSYITFALDFSRAGLTARAYHLTNLIIHLVNAALAFLLLRALFARAPFNKHVPWPRAAALLGALAFAAHPVQTQSVTYVVQRMNLLAALFTLAALLLFIRFRDRPRQKNSTAAAWWASIFAAIGLGLASKENAVAAVPLILAVDRCAAQRGFFGWLKSRPYLVGGAVAAGLAAALFYRATGGALLAGYAGRDFTMAERLLTEPRVVLGYVSLWLFPAGARLSLEHEVMTSTGLFAPPATAVALAVLAAATLYALWRSERAPLLCLGWLWFVGGLALESSFLPLELAFEHRLYLPSLGLVMMLTDLAARVRAGRKAAAVLGVAVALLWVNTYLRNTVWSDGIGLWRDTVEKAPGRSRAWSNLGAAYYLADDDARAAWACREAIARDPENADAWHDLGLALYRQAKWAESVQALTRAAALDPSRPETIYQRGRARARQGRYAEAESDIKQAISLRPSDPVYYYQLGLMQLAQGKKDDGARSLLRARGLTGPGDEKVMKDIDEALRMAGPN
ncbi:MAG TPA: tetratricopeptide repeat protein [bacterium]|nr:tetratricopeptide repeat protein [bacterium]